MRPQRTLLATLPVILLVFAVSVGLGACDDPAEIQNAAPRVTWVAVGTPTTSGTLTVSEVTLWVSDLEGDSVDVTAEVVDSAGQATPMAMAPGGHGLSGLTTRDALDGYRAAFELALKKDGTLKEVHIGLNTLVSYEAGKAILRLLDGDRQYPGRHPLRRNVSTALKKLEALPPGVVTPVIFTRGKHDALADLLAKGKGVRFDLNGDGRVERWPWVRPTTAILVWDPKGTGRITSGRQLFGNATWWLLFEDGYRALDALDDSRDGKLTGNELRGIAVWYDRNANGVSDAGEVTPAARAGIRAIATRSTGSHDGCPMARAGITFDDTTTAHTYDWIASPLD